MAKYIVETSLVCEIVIEAENLEAACNKVEELENAGLCWDHYVVDQGKLLIDLTSPERPVTAIDI